MILQQWLTLAVGCILISVSSQRRCAFHVTPRNYKFTDAGNVNGSEQVCKDTQCCVGYYVVVNGRPEVDILACDKVERHCPDATCTAQALPNGRTLKCVCNTDLCNSNITWSQDALEKLEDASSYPEDDTVKGALILIGILLVFCFLIIQWRNFFMVKNKNSQSFDSYGFSQLHSHQTKKPCDIDVADIELQQIVCRGSFATVWLGTYQGSRVAVKVFPGSWKHKFTAEKDIYELPLMRHSGIVHFLGTAQKPYGDSWLIVLQFAENGSLRKHLHENSIDWMSALKLCLALSQGLAYLHSDLHREDSHKPPVAHGDLSSSNVLVRADGACVLCDFGCSTILHSFPGPRRWSHKTTLLDSVRWGTLRYMAPELLEGSVNLQNKAYLMYTDVYSLALLLWEIWMRCSDLSDGSVTPRHQLPYESELGANVSTESLIWHVCHMDMRPSIPQHWGSALEGILTDCWDVDPDARLTAQCVADRLVSLQSCHNVPTNTAETRKRNKKFRILLKLHQSSNKSTQFCLDSYLKKNMWPNQGPPPPPPPPPVNPLNPAYPPSYSLAPPYAPYPAPPGPMYPPYSPNPVHFPAGMKPPPMGNVVYPGPAPPFHHHYPVAPCGYPGVPPSGVFPGPYPHAPKWGHHKGHHHHHHHHGMVNHASGSLGGALMTMGMGLVKYKVDKKMRKKMKKAHKGHKHWNQMFGKYSSSSSSDSD